MPVHRKAERCGAAVVGAYRRSRSTRVVVAGLLLSSCAPDPNAPVGFRVEETTIAEIHAAFAAGTLTCRELVTMYLDRIRAYDKDGPALNAITTVNPRALDDAAALDERWQRSGPSGPLHCIPVLLKDNINTTDMPTTSGSAILKNTTALDDAAVVKRLENAGALILGKAGMGELAAGGYNTVHGQQLNPYDTSVTMAGSSSGSGASVAANLTAVAIGTDTYTSVRSPAAATSIVGFRPTTGLISRNGISPRKAGIDTAGPMARTVRDAVIVLNVLAGPDPADPRSLDVHANYPAAAKTDTGYADFTQYLATGALRGARIGVAEDFFGSDPEIDALARAAAARMQELGAELVEVRFDPGFFERYVRGWVENLDEVLVWGFREQWEAYLKTLQPGVPGTVAEWVRIYENELTQTQFPPATGRTSALPMLKASLEHSSSDPEYVEMIEQTLPMITRTKLATFDSHGVDALVFPYQAQPSPAVLGGYDSVGFPMIVVPMGFSMNGMPAGITFMGRPYDESKLIGYAYDYEQATKLRRPSPLTPPLAAATSRQ
jgi:amidase